MGTIAAEGRGTLEDEVSTGTRAAIPLYAYPGQPEVARGKGVEVCDGVKSSEQGGSTGGDEVFNIRASIEGNVKGRIDPGTVSMDDETKRGEGDVYGGMAAGDRMKGNTIEEPVSGELTKIQQITGTGGVRRREETGSPYYPGPFEDEFEAAYRSYMAGRSSASQKVALASTMETGRPKEEGDDATKEDTKRNGSGVSVRKWHQRDSFGN